MSRASGDASGLWLANKVAELLQQRYGAGRVPSIRTLTGDIRDANPGEWISRSQVHKILAGRADNITDRTRVTLARFFGVPPTDLMPAAQAPESVGHPPSVGVLALRLATLSPEELAAIQKAIDLVTRDDPTARDRDEVEER